MKYLYPSMYDSKKEYIPSGSVKFKSMSAALIKHEEDAKIVRDNYKKMSKEWKGPLAHKK